MGRALPVLAAALSAMAVVLWESAVIPLLAAAVVAGWLVAKEGGRRTALLLTYISLPVIALNILLVPVGNTPLLSLYFNVPIAEHIVVLSWQITLESIAFGLAMAARLVAVTAVFMILARSLPPEEIFSSAPSKTTLTLASSARFIPVMERDVLRSREAQMARGLYTDTGGLASVRSSWIVFYPLLSRTVERAGELAEAYHTKGLHAGRIKGSPAPPSHMAFSAVLLVLAGLFIVLSGQYSVYPTLTVEAVTGEPATGVAFITIFAIAVIYIKGGAPPWPGK